MDLVQTYGPFVLIVVVFGGMFVSSMIAHRRHNAKMAVLRARADEGERQLRAWYAATVVCATCHGDSRVPIEHAQPGEG